jgi:hypothetical protein
MLSPTFLGVGFRWLRSYNSSSLVRSKSETPQSEAKIASAMLLTQGGSSLGE